MAACLQRVKREALNFNTLRDGYSLSRSYGMAESTPWQLARPTLPKVRKQEILGRDLYNFTAQSVTQGTNYPVVNIPSMGPHAAGAIPPTLYPQVVAVAVTTTGSVGPEYGVNSHQPS